MPREVSIRFGTESKSVTLPNNNKEFNQDWMIILQAPLTTLHGWRKSNVLSWLTQQQNRSYSQEVSATIQAIKELPGDGNAIVENESVSEYNGWLNDLLYPYGNVYFVQSDSMQLYGSTYSAPYSCVPYETRGFLSWLGF